MKNLSIHFADAMSKNGIKIAESIIFGDGKIHRFHIHGDKQGSKNGWYVYYPDGVASGVYGSWKSGEIFKWCQKSNDALTPSERKELSRKVEVGKRARDEEDARIKELAKRRASEIWQASTPATNHPYLKKKGIQPHGTRIYKDDLVIPVMIDQETHSLQFIQPSGNKIFLQGGRIGGCYFLIGIVTGDTQKLCIAEGFATGASIAEATGYPVAVAFHAGNLIAVAKKMRERFGRVIVICADDDYLTKDNPGVTKAIQAAKEINALITVPKFGETRPEKATDFNDMVAICGNEEVRKSIENADKPDAMPCRTDKNQQMVNVWQEPQPIIADVAEEPYPLDALPKIIRDAVEEVQGFTKAPLPMVASSALAVLSIAAQAHFDIERAHGLSGPVSLFILTLADSGERKSTVDGYFTKVIRDYESAQSLLVKPLQEQYQADLEAWESTKAGIKKKITSLAIKGEPTTVLKDNLRALEKQKPTPPCVPRLLYSDATAESLAFSLSKNWPVGGIASAEAGIVFGGHAMSSDSVMKNLSLLNVLWDGGSINIDRRTSESFMLHDARLSMSLQVQDATLKSFFKKAGELARGTGFLARFLLAWPKSTQGFRPFTQAPHDWPALTRFNHRITAILNKPAPLGEDGTLLPSKMGMSGEALAAWETFYNAVENELAIGAELHEVRDIASKTPDNAARLAALFQIVSDENTPVSLEAFEGASRVAAWHLQEAKRYLSDIALSDELARASRLDNWLLGYCKRMHTNSVSIRTIQQFGPGALRKMEALNMATRELEKLFRVRAVNEGRSRMIEVNPALLAEAKL